MRFIRQFRILFTTSFLTFAVSSGAFSQTPGMIYEPATGGGAAVLDPNGDGYTSATTAGFSTDDQLQSEIPYSSLIFPGQEPTSDLANAPDCGFTDFVDQGDRDPAQKYLSPSGNWLFRLRMGSISPNAKSYSILIDSDGLFGNTGANADPNYTSNNPGFEIEIVLATKFGVYVYNCNTPCTPVISYPGTTNYQKSIAGSTNCSDLDFFLDFYVVYADLVAQFPGLNVSTPMRYVIVDNTAANASTICQPNSASDIGGVGPCPNLAACFTEIINAQAFCSPDQVTCTYRSDCPVLTTPVSVGATSVSGTSTEATGTSIKVYKNGVLIGTTTVTAGGLWSLTGISPALANGNVITVTATATGEYESLSDCNSYTITSCSGTSAQITLGSNGPKGFCGTGIAGAVIKVYDMFGNLQTPNPANLVVDATGNWEWKCNGSTGCTAGTAQCLCDGSYYITQTVSGQCESPGYWICVERTGSTDLTCNLGSTTTLSTPTITTTPILTSTTSISGTVVAPDNVAGVTILLFADGYQIGTVTTTAGGAWSISSLNLTSRACQTITAKAIKQFQCISAASNSVVITGGQTTAPVIDGPFCVSSNVTSVSGTSTEANGTFIQLFVNGTATGSPVTVSSGTWTVTGVSIAAGSIITAKATATCKTQSAASSSYTVTSQSASTGLSITTSPVYEQGTSLTGTGVNGTQVQVYIDNYPIGSPVTVSGGTWTLSGIQPYELYPYGVLSVTSTAAGSCGSQPVTGATVQCIVPSNALTVNPASAEFCTATGTVSVSVLSSTSGVVYQLFLADGTTTTGSSVLGTGGTITLVSGTLSASTTLQVKAFKLPVGACYVFETDVVPVTFGTTPTLSLTVAASPATICSGGNSTVTVANSQSGYSYQLRNNATNANVGSAVTGTGASINLPTGLVTSTTTYNVFVTGPAPALCTGQLTSTATVTVNSNPAAPTASVTVQPTCAITTGTIVVSSPASGTGFEYSLDGGAYQASATFTGAIAGSHAITVRNTSTLCESPVTLLTVNTAPSAPSAPAVSVTQPTCATPTGTIVFTAQSGVEYSVNGTTYQASVTFSGLSAGTYTPKVRSTTDNTCTATGTSVTIVAALGAPTAPTASVTVQPTCATPTGTIVVSSPASGTGYEYSLDGGAYQASSTFAGVAAGSHSVTVRRTADITCESSATSVTVNAALGAPTAPTASVTVQPTCATPTGTIVVSSPASGTGYEYSLDGGTYQASSTFAGVAAGSHSVTVRRTADNTCESSATSVTVNTAPGAPSAPAVSVTQPTCATPTGTIVFTAQSGVEYSVNGTTYQASVTFSGLSAGTYTPKVRSTTDNTCTATGTSVTIVAALGAPTAPTASVTVQPTCATPTGTIVVSSPASGTGYEYSLDGGAYQASSTFAGVAAGSHSVTVRRTADITCESSATSVTVNAALGAPTAPTASVTVQPTCATPTGTIVVSSPASGTGYEYSLDGGTYQASSTFAGVAAGSHSVTVRRTADNTCESSATSVTVNTAPGAPSAPAVSVTQPTCATPTGTIVFTAQSGVEYSVNGTTYQASVTFSGLSAGTYTPKVRSTTDNTCTATGTSVTIVAALGAPTAPTASVTVQPTCATPTGTIVVSSPASGTGYEYSLDGGAYQASSTFAGVAAGSHSVTVRRTADITCESSATSVTVNAALGAPTAPTASVTVQPTCATPTGTIVVSSPASGTGYEYSLDGGTYQASSTFAGVAAGSHSVTVRRTADNTCVSSATSVTVNAALGAPTAPTASVTVQPTCATPTGTIVVSSPASGTGYEYSLDGGTYQASSTFAGVAAGSHSVTVRRTADNTCVSSATSVTVVAAPGAPSAPAVSVTQPTCATPTGTIVFTAQSGVEYSVNGTTYQASVTFSGLSAGTYTPKVRSTTDNTCTATGTSVTIVAALGAPTAPTASVTVQPTCAVQSATIVVSSPAAGTGYEYSLDGGAYQSSSTFAGVAAGSHSVTVRRTADNTCVSSATNVTVNAIPVCPPTANNDSGSANEDVSVVLPAIQSNDTDIDGNVVVSTIDLDPSTLGQQTTLTTTDGTWSVDLISGNATFTPNANFNGTSSITYVIYDNSGLISNTATLSATINAVNDAPNANTDVASTNEDTPVTINVPSNDTDLDGNIDPTSVTITDQPSNGTVSVDPTTGAITYTPNANFNGTDTLIYQICDNGTPLPGQCDTAMVIITVNAVNDAPNANTDVASTNEETPVTINVPSNDTDLDGNIDPTSVTITDQPSNGTVSVDPTTGVITYTPNANFNGTDTLIYQICDNGTPLPGQCDTAMVIITVNAVNDAPNANTDVASTNEETPVTINVPSNDTDLDGNIDPTSVTITDQPSNGTVSVDPTTGVITYTPNANFNGTDTLIYQICDNGTPLPGQCDTAMVIITVNAVNDVPNANTDVASTNEDTPVTINVPSNDTDSDGNIDPTSVTITQQPSNGTVSVDPTTGVITYTPNANFNGTDTLIYQICDNGTPLPAQCDTAMVIITVNAVNDAPNANTDVASTNEETPVTINVPSNDTDSDGNIDPTSVTITQQPSNGTVSVDPTTGAITYTPNANFNGTDTLIYQICDNGTPLPAQCDTAMVIITVNAVNDAPNANTDVASTNEDTPVTINVPSNDTDSDGNIDPTSVTITQQPSNGTVSVDPTTGAITYTPNANFNGTDTLIYQICDNGTPLPAQCDTAMVIISVNSCLTVAAFDCDGDGVTNGDEIDPDGDGTPGPNGTDPSDPCSLTLASQTVAPSSAWLDLDCDGDGVTNGDEIDPDGDGTPGPNGTDPNDPCLLILASQTVAPSSAWLDLDCDGDGVTNGDEIDPDGDGTPGPNGTDPSDPCSFILTAQTVTPTAAWSGSDCDGDGVTNNDEIDPDGNGTPGPNGTDPNDPCSLILAAQTVAPSATWLGSDCDDDGLTNGEEISGGNNPFDPCDPNPTQPDCIKDITIPQAFTPDGNNSNELFVIEGIENYPDNQLSFFNRWGNEVYFMDGYTNTWDGTSNKGIIVGNEKLPTGTYYYILDLYGDGKTVYKGFVYLKR